MDYLHALGVSHCYASSYLAAVPGSTHGYDVADPSRLNPDVGDEERYARWIEALRRRGMGHIVDVVPNHMGIAQSANPWWQDVLENGPNARQARVFDIDWHPLKPELRDKVLLPILGDAYGAVLERQEIRLEYTGGAFEARYFDQVLPISPGTYDRVLDTGREALLDGFRIDHVDGLYDPGDYLGRVQQRAQERRPEMYAADRPLYVVVEKILGADEELPPWPVAGTTGHDFLAQVNGLFVDGRNEGALTSVYERFARTRARFRDVVYWGKELVLRLSMASELNVLAHGINRFSERNRYCRDFTLNSLTHAVREIIACFPVVDTRQYIPDAERDEHIRLVGTWPFGPMHQAEERAYRDRIVAYMHKAMREAKVFTSWLSPSDRHERAMTRFIETALAPDNRAFRDDFVQFARQLAGYGIYNSLAQLAVKIGAPGVPDFYQGTELWDFSLVDPDNRRPVDYERRRVLIEELDAALTQEGPGALADRLLAAPCDDRMKLYATSTLLRFRRTHLAIFQSGEYDPPTADGLRRDHVFAFARTHDGEQVVVVVPRLVATLVPDGDAPPLGERVWGDTRLALPAGSPRMYRHALTGEGIRARGDREGAQLALSDVFARFPVAVLEGR